MNRARLLPCLVVISFFGFFFSGCSGGSSPITIALSSTTATVQAGGMMQFTATLAHDSQNKGVTWSVTCSGAQCGSVSPTATTSGAPTTYTAPTTAPSSDLTVTITVTSVADSTRKSTITITVPAITVTVAPGTLTVMVGTTGQLTATVANDPASAGVTWSVTCSSAQCGSVSPTTTPSGTHTTYTAPSNPPTTTLTVTITAKSATDTTKSNSATITVPAVTISVMPSTPTVLPGATQQFTATVTNSSNTAVTWKLTQGGAACTAACGTLNNATANPVTYTPPTPAASLTITITATSAADTTKSASATITVPAITVSVMPTSAQVAISGFTTFTATVGNDGANKGVTWTLSQGGVACAPAACGTINAGPTPSGSGTTYQAPASTPANPNVTVTATSVTDPTKSASATAIITPVSVSVSPTTASLVVNGTQQFTATVTFDAHSLGVSWTITSSGTPCPLGCGSVSPSSSLSGVAVTYKAPSTVPGGVVTLTATSTTDPTKSASATITVTAAPPIIVTFVMAPPSSLQVTNSAMVSAHVTNDGTSAGVDWSVTCGSAGACGSFSVAHTATDVATTYTAPAAVPTGNTVTIKAASTADGTKSITMVVTITTAPPISVTITQQPASSLVVSSTTNVTATVTNDSLNKGVDWTVTCGSAGACGSFNPTHTASGAATVYTAPANVPTGNTVTITATSTADNTKSVNANTVTITALVVSISLTTPPPSSLVVSGTANVTATVTNDPANKGVDWTVTCGSAGACGSFNPTHTASGAATVYTAPVSVPTGNTVTIKATSAADNTKSISSIVTITTTTGTTCPLPLGGQESLLTGTYAILFNGWNDGVGMFQAAASIIANGTGGITGGVDDSNGIGLTPKVNQTITSGCYMIATGGRGKMIWTFSGGHSIGFSIVMRADGKNGDLIEFDDPPSGSRGSGTIRKQDTTLFVASTLNGPFAFGVRGEKADNTRAGSLGAFTLDGVSTLSGGAVDYSEPGTSFTGLAATGTFTAPDATHGRGTLTIVIQSVPTIGNLTLHFAYYITRGASGTQPIIYLQSTDTVDSVGHGLQNGIMAKQINTPYSNASLSGTVIFSLTGFDTSHSITNTIVGLATSSGTGTFTGVADQEADAAPLTNQAVSGTISIGANGLGTVQITSPAVLVPTSIVMVATNTALMLEGTSTAPGNDTQTGLMQPQTGGGTFTTGSLTGTLIFGSDEPATTNVGVDVGTVAITSPGNITITQDSSDTSGLQSDTVTTGTYTMSSNGRGTITITGGGSGTAVMYLIGVNKAVVMPRGQSDTAILNLEQ